MADPNASEHPRRRETEASPKAEEREPEPLSPEARAALEAGLESARRGEIKPWGDFTKYVTDDE